jgi:hypothetical protein
MSSLSFIFGIILAVCAVGLIGVLYMKSIDKGDE